MALVVCQGCKGEFSSFTAACPFCGNPADEALPVVDATGRLSLSGGQSAIVGLLAFAEDAVTKISFRFFVPNWRHAAMERFQRNNEALAKRHGD